MAKTNLLEQETGSQLRKYITLSMKSILAGGLLLLFFYISYQFFNGEIHENSRDYLNILLGAFIGSFTKVVSYYFPENDAHHDVTPTGKK